MYTNRYLKAKCNSYRNSLKNYEDAVRDLKQEKFFGFLGEFKGQHEEVKAQIMLAVRHLEDARMRLGKVIQYSEDGVSVFDK